MSLEKLTKQLKRDFKKSPGKVVALGVLCLVAAVFWGPLLFKSDTNKPKPSAKAVPPAVAAAGAATTAPTTATPSAPWREVARSMDTDPRMKSAVPAADGRAIIRSPFESRTRNEIESEQLNASITTLIEQVYGPEALAPKVAAPTPEPAETVGPKLAARALSLTSTLVGGRLRKAIINGRALAEGDPIETFDGAAVTLLKVEPRRAIVGWNGQVRELKILRPGEAPDAAQVAGRMTGESEIDTAGGRRSPNP